MTTPLDLTTVILAHRHDDRLWRALKSVEWCHVIVLVDKSSFANKTLLARFKKEIHSKHPDAEVMGIPDMKHFALARNSAMKWVDTAWTLYLDSDEWVSVELRDEIVRSIQQTDIHGFFIKRQDFFKGKALRFGETARVMLLRLGRTHEGKWKGHVHERWLMEKPTVTLTHPLFHEPHTSLEEFISKINIYTTLVAEERIEKHQTTSLIAMIVFPIGKFLQNYFLKLGLLDGWRGFMYAFIMSLHSFFVRVKMWEMGRVRHP